MISSLILRVFQLTCGLTFYVVTNQSIIHLKELDFKFQTVLTNNYEISHGYTCCRMLSKNKSPVFNYHSRTNYAHNLKNGINRFLISDYPLLNRISGSQKHCLSGNGN